MFTTWPHLITRTSAPGVFQFTILVNSTLIIITIFVWYMPESRKEDSKRNDALTVWLIWPCHCTRTPAQEVMKFTDLVDPSLVIIKMPLSIEDYFFRNTSIIHFLPQNTSPGSERGVWSLKVLVSFPYIRNLYQN